MKGFAPIVRPWLNAGLRTLLLENEERVLALRVKQEVLLPQEKHAVRAPDAPDMTRATVPARGGSPSFRKPSPAVAVQEAPRRPGPAAGVRGGGDAVAPVGSGRQPAARPSSPQSLLATPGALPLEKWPASWLALKNRRPLPSRPLVLWSYAGLGEDLSGKPDEVRRRVIVRMLTELRHPAGTHVFWPFAMQDDGVAPEYSLFWSGVRFLDPRVLLLFGSDTRDALAMPKTLLPFCQERVHGRLVIQLPRPQALAEDEASFQRAQAFLARILRFCASR